MTIEIPVAVYHVKKDPIIRKPGIVYALKKTSNLFEKEFGVRFKYENDIWAPNFQYLRHVEKFGREQEQKTVEECNKIFDEVSNIIAIKIPYDKKIIQMKEKTIESAYNHIEKFNQLLEKDKKLCNQIIERYFNQSQLHRLVEDLYYHHKNKMMSGNTDSRIALTLTKKSNQCTGRRRDIGVTLTKENYAITIHQNIMPDIPTLQHELSHVFGAEHTYDDSVMNECKRPTTKWNNQSKREIEEGLEKFLDSN